MEDNASVRKLLKLLLYQFEDDKEIMPKNSASPTCWPTNDFVYILHVLLCGKIMIFNSEWHSHINIFSEILFSSHSMYLKCVIFSCLMERRYHDNAFEMFISVCALLKYWAITMHYKTYMDFCDLNTDVFMVVYDNLMKSNFCEEGGFQQLAEYIRGHEYCSWNWEDLDSTDAAACDTILKRIQVEREMKKSGTRRTMDELKTMQTTSRILAQKVISTTSVELPTFSNSTPLIERLKESWNEENAEKCKNETIVKEAAGFVISDTSSQRCSYSNSDSNTNHTINRENNAAPESSDLDVTSRGSSSSNSDSKTDPTINGESNTASGFVDSDATSYGCSKMRVRTPCRKQTLL